MSIAELSEESQETVKRLADLNHMQPEDVLRQMEAPIDSPMVTRHQLELRLA